MSRSLFTGNQVPRDTRPTSAKRSNTTGMPGLGSLRESDTADMPGDDQHRETRTENPVAACRNDP